MFLSGIERQTTQMSTSSALVCTSFLFRIILIEFLAALDPNYKVTYAKAKWASQDFDDGMRRLEDVVSSWVSQ
jgi:hypothetical protein